MKQNIELLLEELKDLNKNIKFDILNESILCSSLDDLILPDGYSIISDIIFFEDYAVCDIEEKEEHFIEKKEIEEEQVKENEIKKESLFSRIKNRFKKVKEEKNEITTEEELKKEIERLNPNSNISLEINEETGEKKLLTNYKMEELVLPEDFYYDENGLLTNKDNTKNNVIELEPSFINEEKKEKKGLFRKIGRTIFFPIRYAIGRFTEWFGRNNTIDTSIYYFDDENREKLNVRTKTTEELNSELIDEVEKISKEVDETRVVEKKPTVEELLNNISENEPVNKVEQVVNVVNNLPKDEAVLEQAKVELEENISDEKEVVIEEPKKDSNRYTFVSIEDTKSKFFEFDKNANELEKLKEKISYYETFIRTHYLSHKDDKKLLFNMLSKLEVLKVKYSSYEEKVKEESTLENDDLRMKYYTQVSMGIMEKENKIDEEIKTKTNELTSIIPVWNKETFRFEEGNRSELESYISVLNNKKNELIELRNECLKRKEMIMKKYYLKGKKIMDCYRK